MSRLVWLSAVLVPVVVGALGLRWALADFLVDRFGSRPDSLTRAEHPEGERVASDRAESRQSSFPSSPSSSIASAPLIHRKSLAAYGSSNRWQLPCGRRTTAIV